MRHQRSSAFFCLKRKNTSRFNPASMKLLQLFLPLKPLRLFLPQDLPYWIGTIVFLGFFYYYCKESILSVKGLVFLSISVAIVVALAIFVPFHWVKRIALTHPFIRGTAYGLIAYIFIASLGLFPEIWSFRNWWELLTLNRGQTLDWFGPATSPSRSLFAGRIPKANQKSRLVRARSAVWCRSRERNAEGTFRWA